MVMSNCNESIEDVTRFAWQTTMTLSFWAKRSHLTVDVRLIQIWNMAEVPTTMLLYGNRYSMALLGITYNWKN